MSSSNLDVGTRRYLKRKNDKPAYKSDQTVVYVPHRFSRAA